MSQLLSQPQNCGATTCCASPLSVFTGLAFKGVIDGSSVPSKSTALGDFYIIGTPGTSQGKNWNVGDQAIYLGSSGQWAQVAIAFPFLNVRMFGAQGTGLVDDTAAFNAGIAILAAVNGGILYVPNGLYPANLTITNKNIVILGCGINDVETNTTKGLMPWDTSKPVIQVGDDSSDVDGFVLRDIAIFGRKGGVDCPSCIYLAGGAVGAKIAFVGAINGLDTIKFKTGASHPCTRNVIEQCDFWEGTNSTVLADDTRSGDPNSYTTANRFIGCYVNGANATGYAVKVINGNAVDFDSTYFDTSPDHSFYSLNGGQARFAVSNLDNGSDTLNGATIEWTTPNPDHDLTRYLKGQVRVTGQIKWIDSGGTTLVNLPPDGIDFWIGSSSMVRSPYTIAPFYVTSVTDPTRKEYTIDLSGSDGVLTLAKTYGAAQFKLGILHVDANFQILAGNSGSFFLFDCPQVTNTAANVRLWGNTNTSANCRLDIYSGDGTASLQHSLTSKGDVLLCQTTGFLGVKTNSPKSALHVVGLPIYANNAAAIAGGLTAGAFYRTGADPDPVCVVH